MEKHELLDVLKEKNLTLSSMESLTGGLFSATFTSIPGASEVFQGAAVTYQDNVKSLFGVSPKTIQEHGAISSECAREMALSAAKFFQTDCSVSFTGNAGPSAEEDKPVGLVFIAVLLKDHLYKYELHLSGDREEIRKACVDFAFRKMVELLKEPKPAEEPVANIGEEKKEENL
ncbi:MAG: CinA family protein [Bacilli bacterium]|jgi:PncC family amidohydrolase|nr:CinA family protein [Bacilli bacterium]